MKAKTIAIAKLRINLFIIVKRESETTGEQNIAFLDVRKIARVVCLKFSRKVSEKERTRCGGGKSPNRGEKTKSFAEAALTSAFCYFRKTFRYVRNRTNFSALIFYI